MVEFKLTSAPPLAGYHQRFGSVTLRSPDDLAIVNMAIPLGKDSKATKAVGSGYGVDLPEPGKSVVSKKGAARLVRLAPDQVFAIFKHPTPDAEEAVAERTKTAFYLTDQTDVWTGLELSGPGSLAALERICPIDLHPLSFAVDDAARTVMEHLGVLIIRTGEDQFLLLSASSSAGSFLHMLETSIKNVQQN
ncbi:MAG: sarcosine oxidase subunit gamma family protein [Pseudomonadota bacterium]